MKPQMFGTEISREYSGEVLILSCIKTELYCSFSIDSVRCNGKYYYWYMILFNPTDASITTAEPVPSICDSRQGRVQFGLSCYFYPGQAQSWNDANTQCNSQGNAYGYCILGTECRTGLVVAVYILLSEQIKVTYDSCV